MARYLVTSEGPISVRKIERPDIELPDRPTDPDYGIEAPTRPGHGLPPSLPPRDEWPPLPPFLKPGVGLPIPPVPDFPMVPVPPGDGTAGQLPELPPGMVWPPIRPEWPQKPEFGNKALALALVFVSGHGAHLRWIVVDLDATPKPPIAPSP